MLSEIFSDRKTHRVWIVFLVLSPLAYLGGLMLASKYDTIMRLGLAVDREQATKLASQYALSKGVDVTGWDKFYRLKPQNDLLFYYRLRAGVERDRARLLAPEAVIGVRFRSPDWRENIEVLLSPDGRGLGHGRCISKSVEAKTPAEEISRKIAEDAVKVRQAALGVSYSIDLNTHELRSEDCHSGSTAVRIYRWRWPTPSLSELELQSILTVRGETLIGDEIRATVDGKFAKQYLHSGSTIFLIGKIIYGAVMLIVVIFGLYRFVQRAQQKEVSYSRVFLLTLIFSGVSAIYVLLTDIAIYDISSRPEFPIPDWVIISIGAISNLFVGIFFGLAYGSGEGDIREAYPGKLSSVDALITGKIFSQNVARAVLVGCAVGGWLSLFSGLATLPWEQNQVSGSEIIIQTDGWLGRAPSIWALIICPSLALMIAVIGLLIPLSFFHRRFKSPRIIIPLVAAFMWVACTTPYQEFRPRYAILPISAVMMTIVMLAFFKFDLLTILVGMAAQTYVYFSAALALQPSPSLRLSGIISLGAGLGVPAIASFFAVRGRVYREDDVRPIYAKYQAERLSMQAEVTAAREAQKRLMPHELPTPPHFSLAASCLPAFDVGGDFYDIFEMHSGKLGVLIAEGGGKGLGSALSIAFAKGFILPKVMGSRNNDDSPAEIIRGLQDRMVTLTFEDAGTGFLFAVIDPEDGTLRYARTGSYPSLLVSQPGMGKFISPLENALRFKSTLGRDNDVVITEGSIRIELGESVIFFTDGLAKNWAKKNGSPEVELSKVLASNRSESNQELQSALTEVIKKTAKHARKNGLEDDLTAVIVKLKKE
ncbi:MAG: SpoIIE family protein phosphatase [Acidobacteria bacterium]|nr:SpoIIE family protein phosphatase [Acidobacteriota bacterium]